MSEVTDLVPRLYDYPMEVCSLRQPPGETIFVILHDSWLNYNYIVFNPLGPSATAGAEEKGGIIPHPDVSWKNDVCVRNKYDLCFK